MERSFGNTFISTLVGDVDAAIQRRNAQDTLASRRDLIRSAFAAIDGFIWAYREQVSSAAADTWGLEDEEVAALAEVSYIVTEQGKIVQRPSYLSSVAAIRLVSRIAERINGVSHLDFSGNEWARFRDAIQIRNRITHPKSEEDLDISGADIQMALDAFFWLFEKLTDTMADAVQTRIDYLGEFKDVFEKLKTGDPEITSLYNAIRRQDRDN